MAVWSEVNFHEVAVSTRFDAEFYKPLYLRYASLMQRGELLQTQATISHPTEVVRVYEEKGIQILLAQNIRANRLDFSYSAFMSADMAYELRRNLLQKNDVVMTRSGANYGDTAVYKGTPAEIYACADVLILRPNDMPGGYLSTFFNTEMGRAILDRGAYGAAQPHIAPNYLNELKVLRFSSQEREIDSLVEAAYAKEEQSGELYGEAETLLLDALGLNNLNAMHSIAYERNFQEVARAGRFDAAYFSPRAQSALHIMRRSGKTLGDVAPLAKRKFKPQSGEEFHYIEIGDLGGDGHAESTSVAVEDAPSRAQWVVRPRDVITSMVRPIRRLSALIEPKQNGFVCSSGFAVLKPRDVEPEILLVYLRSPIVCEILDLHTTATMYPAIATDTLLNIPFTAPEPAITKEIVSKVRASRAAHDDAQSLLESAKRRVEELIEEGA